VVWRQVDVASNWITTDWIDVFDNCTRRISWDSYFERTRYDACAVPQRAKVTECTWIAAQGRVCAYRGLSVDWMSNEGLNDYCTDEGMYHQYSIYIWDIANYSRCLKAAECFDIVICYILISLNRPWYYLFSAIIDYFWTALAVLNWLSI